MEEDEKAKAKTGEVQNDSQVPPPATDTEPSKIVSPGPDDGEGDVKPEDFEHKYKTLVGQHQKLQKEFDGLRVAGTDFAGVSQKIDDLGSEVRQQGQTLTLLTDIVSAGAEYNEELQGRVSKAKEDSENRVRQTAQNQETIGRMGQIAKIVKIEPSDEALKPAWAAFNKGDHTQAIELTIIAAQGKVPAVQVADPADSPKGNGDKKVDKDKLKQLNVVPSVGEDWRVKSSTDKIKSGIAKRDED